MSKKHKVLIVDDEPDFVELLQLRLESEGYEVITAAEGKEGLEKAREVNPDVILLDVMMPKMDGYQVCRFLKFDEAYHNIPIIMLTARGQERDKAVGRDVGADAYITKPFENEELLVKMKELLK